MKLRLLSCTLIFALLSTVAWGQVLPKPGDIPKEYRSEYRKELREAERTVKESDSDIQLPPMEMVPVEKLTPTEFSAADFSNWGKAAIAPDDVLERLAAAAKYRVFFDCYDTGIDEDHPDMQVGKLPSRDGVNEPGGDKNGHGSHVWSTVMGKRGGLVYVLAEKGLLKGRATKVLNGGGSGSFSSYAGMHEAGFTQYKQWVDDGAFVVTNSSLGANISGPLSYVEDALREGYEYGGITHVAAAGNSNSDVDYPASSPFQIATGAVDRNLKRAYFSCYGPNLVAVAPGVGITACWKDGNYATISGTSMASPFLSGWCIAAYSVWGPKLAAPGAMEEYLSALTRDLGDEGFDDYYGWGLSVLNKIVETDPGEVDQPDNPDDPDDPTDPTDPGEPVDFISTVTFEVDGETFRYRTQYETTFRLMDIDDMVVTVSCKCTEEQAYDLGYQTVSDYFDYTAMVIPDDPEFGYSTTAWWTGQFLEYQAKQKSVDLQVTSLKGTDSKGRNALVSGFDRAKVKSLNDGVYFGAKRIDNVRAMGQRSGFKSYDGPILHIDLN